MVYIELIVFVDLFMNYLIILSTGIILNRKSSFKKIFLSSVVGCIPLIFIYIIMNNIIIFLLNIIFAIIMSIISFGYKDIIYTIKNIIYMYFISIFLAGSLYLINSNFFPNTSNQILSLVLLIVFSPIITYIYMKNLKNIKEINSNYYKVDIYLKGLTKYTLNAYLDTGNKLTDPYTHTPIILITEEVLNNYKLEKYILVPYNTIDSHGLIKCFKPEKIYIYDIGYRKKVLIGIINNIGIENAECILNQKLLERI